MTLTEEETVNTLFGEWRLENGKPVSVLSGKFHKISDHKYFSFRLTGIERKPGADAHPIIDELGLKNPERFDDKVIKKTNRHGVVITARDPGFTGEASFVSEWCQGKISYIGDATHPWSESNRHGKTKRILFEGKEIAPPSPREDFWCVEVYPVVFIDHQIDLEEDEPLKKITSEDYFDRSHERDMDESHFQMQLTGSYQILVATEDVYTPKPFPKRMKLDGVMAIDLFDKNVIYHVVGFAGLGKEANDKFIDQEKGVENKILKFESSYRADVCYRVPSCLQGGSYIMGPLIHY